MQTFKQEMAEQVIEFGMVKEEMSHNHDNPMRVSSVSRSRLQTRSTYDRLSRWYDLLSGSYERRHRNAGIQMMAPHEGDVVLEIGFGTGHAIVALAEMVGRIGKVYGIDISQGMLDVAKARVEAAGLTGRVILECGDAMRLPYEADFFDGIFISFTLELFDTSEIPQVLSECRRTLQSGGRICILALSRKGKLNAITKLYEWLHEKLPQVIDCRPIYVQEAMEAAGFHILEASEVSLSGLHAELVLAEKTG